ncbi:MAG TPA: glycoside hydrolase family 15 protein [Thermoanaerobaculia bacterium]|nr:glycoside hydrolase family 15 protein [Thermoanaerobaculia bacterium]
MARHGGKAVVTRRRSAAGPKPGAVVAAASSRHDAPAGASRPGSEAAPVTSAYLPLRDYALIGDCHGAALVSRSGSIDWCTFGRFDSAPVFCRILDANRGGSFSVEPTVSFTSEPLYVAGTNILETTFRTADGSVRLIDFMPVGRREGAGLHDYVTLEAPAAVVRIIEGVEGRVPLRIRFDPTSDYGAHRPTLATMESGVTSSDGTQLRAAMNFRVEGISGAICDLEVAAGDRHELVLHAAMTRAPDLSAAELLRITRSFWEEWSAYSRYSGEQREAVVRSALALKLMTYAPSGALVAAPTTSLPEAIGSERNWDYRYCWLRDSTLTLYALSVLGYSGEAKRFHDYLLTACHSSYPRLQIMYGIDAEPELPERTLEYLEGYERSRPVRIGNAAHDQKQHDVVGEVVGWAHLYEALGGRLGKNTKGFVVELANRVLDEWQEPDSGLWESRAEPKRYVYSSVMSWVALDRAARLVGSRSQKRQWKDAADEIVKVVLSEGVDGGGSLVAALGETDIDAALLRVPFTGFPLEQPTIEATVERVRNELAEGPFVNRYAADDRLKGREGAFLLCSFWLVDALLWLGRTVEARRNFEQLLDAANEVGLYSEEIDSATNALLGNFPQAFTHLALIHTATLFELAGDDPDAIRATDARLAKKLVGATAGPFAAWRAFRQSGRLGRFRSSRDSMMPRKAR